MLSARIDQQHHFGSWLHLMKMRTLSLELCFGQRCFHLWRRTWNQEQNLNENAFPVWLSAHLRRSVQIQSAVIDAQLTPASFVSDLLPTCVTVALNQWINEIYFLINYQHISHKHTTCSFVEMLLSWFGVKIMTCEMIKPFCPRHSFCVRSLHTPGY